MGDFWKEKYLVKLKKLDRELTELKISHRL